MTTIFTDSETDTFQVILDDDTRVTYSPRNDCRVRGAGLGRLVAVTKGHAEEIATELQELGVDVEAIGYAVKAA